MYEQFTVAVAGTGFIGPVHVEALRRLGIRVKGVLGSTPQKSEAARKQLGLEHAYASFEAMLADEELQAVHLAVPNVLHYDYAKGALLAGKHVLCEKPLAMHARETEELVALARSTGLAAGVAYNTRYYPLNQEAKTRIENGALGEIYSVVGSYVQDWLLYDTDYNWRVLAEQGGQLRAISDIGTHWMDLITHITGLEVEAVFADLKTVHPIRKRPKGEVRTFSGEQLPPEALEEVPVTTDDCGSVLFRFRGGARGMLWVSQTTAGYKNCERYEIAGARQSLSWSSVHPNELLIGHRNKPNELLYKDWALVGERAAFYADYPGGHNEGFADTFKQCFKAFYEAIARGLPPEAAQYPTFMDGHREVLLCDAILQSHRNQRWVNVH
ncbi:MAG: gfo/Idh/MocA family oxidoreductase [Bacteroidetes bacterium]|nr:MAG: gfo/Idh/MocA family oxidoreductase [Bacteroidota bacterium]